MEENDKLPSSAMPNENNEFSTYTSTTDPSVNLRIQLTPENSRMLGCECCGNDVGTWSMFVVKDTDCFLPTCNKCGYCPVAFSGVRVSTRESRERQLVKYRENMLRA